MNKTAWKYRLPATCAAVLTAGSITLPSAAATPQLPSRHCPVAAVSYDGSRIQGNPPRYRYSNSPYLGAVSDQCSKTVTLYYGNYTSNVYNIRWSDSSGNAKQIEVPNRGGPRQKTMSWSRFSEESKYYFTVQACNKGGLFTSSSCTAWSPTLGVPINLGEISTP
jgi:hypothetical protein